MGLAAAPLVEAVTNPAAGADFSFTLPSNRAILSIAATLTTSATAGNRTPSVQLKDSGGHVLFTLSSAVVQAASTTDVYQWVPSAVNQAATSPFMLAFPSGMVVPSGGTIASVTSGILAGDQWSAIVIELLG